MHAALCVLQEVGVAIDAVVKDLCMSMRSRWMQSQDRAPYLNQLHERLDYNGYLSKATPLDLRSKSQQQQQDSTPPRARRVARPLYEGAPAGRDC